MPKSFLSALLIACCFAVAIIAFLYLFSENSRLTDEVTKTKNYLSLREDNLKTVSILANRSWYCVNDTTASSEKDGKGEIIHLPVNVGMYTRYGKEDVNGIRIWFFPVSSPAKPTYTVWDYLTYHMGGENDYKYWSQQQAQLKN